MLLIILGLLAMQFIVLCYLALAYESQFSMIIELLSRITYEMEKKKK